MRPFPAFAIGDFTGDGLADVVFVDQNNQVVSMVNTGNGLQVLVFLAMWEAHYLHRAFIYPLTLHVSPRRMPLLIVFFGLFFN